MNRPSFSIVVPIYGVEKYIRQCADSVLGQTYDKVQFVFVNDGTKDDSMQVLDNLIEEKYAHLKDRIVIVNKENEGLPAARRTGVSHATGDYILHVDSDDWVETDMVEKIAAEAIRSGSDIICFKIFKEEVDRQKIRGDRKYRIEQKSKFLRDIMDHTAYGYTVNKCAKRCLYTDNNVHFARFGMFEDVFLMTQLVDYAGSYAHIDDPLYHYRRTNLESISRQKRSNKRLYASMNMLDLYRAFKDDIPSSPIRETVGRIFYHAAWCSIAYKLDLFSKYPEIAGMIRSIPVSTKNLMPLTTQFFVKAYVLVKGLR